MASADSTNLNKAIVLVILMITMTQVGYLENLNPWTNGGEALEDAEPVVAHSPSTSVMYGNNSMWTSTIGPIKHAEYIALAYDAVLFQAAPNKNSMKGCPMAYNASNATVWQPNTGSTSLCAGMVGRYVAMIDDITYFTYRTSTSQVSNGLGGDLYAYNPGNDTIYLISNQNGRVQTGVGIGRTIYFTSHTYSPSFAVNLMSYNVDNQTTSTLSSPGFYQDRLIVVGSKILTYSPTGTMGSEAFNTENNTWYSVPSLPSNGIFGDPAPGVVSNGQLLFVGTDSATVASSTSGNGSEYWIYDSNNDTAWPLGDFCATTACNGGLPFHEDDGLPQIRNGMDMYFITRSYDSSTSSPSNGDTMYDLWGYSTLNATTWHMTNLTATFNNVGSYNTGDYRAHIKLAMLANGDFVISSSMAHPSPTYESAFYSPTNDTIWQPNLCSSCGNPQGTSGVDAQHSRLLGVYGNTVYFAKYGALLAYNVENQTAASQIIPGATSSYLNGAPVLFGSTFAMAHHCGDGSSNTCPNGQRNTLLQWAPESVTVSDAWNLTPGQRIDGPITGGNGIHFDSGVGVQSMTASAAGAELPVGLAMTDITFEYIGPTTYGNYSTWEATNINSPAYSMPGASMQILVGDTFYFDASDQTNGTELWAYDTSNHSEWRVDDIRPGSLASQPGTSMSILVGDTIYFSADDGSTGKELWAHDTSNHSAWRVDDINSGSADSHPGNLMELLIGDTLYFSADDGTTGRELWAHNTSNSSDPWQVADINSGVGHGDPGKHLSMVIDDVLYFSADDGSTGGELYAYNTSNGSDPWLVADLFSGVTGSSPGHFMQVLVDDIIYFDARGGNSNGIELWSYDTTDHSTQRVTDINSGTGHSRPGAYFSTLVGDTIYFSATDGTTGVELWAYDTSNHSTWRVADINDGSQDSKPGEHLNLLVGDTIYFSADDGSTDVELWAHDTSNHSTWLVDDICSVGACNLPPAFGRPTGSVPGYNMQVLVGDTFYFDAFNTGAGAELWAHDTSNDSTWNVAEMTSGTGSGISAISSSMLQIAVGDTLYFSAQDGSNSMELWAHRGAEFTPPPANVNGASSCSSSPSLPLGLSIDSSTCTISGTPTVEAVNETYTVTAVLSGVTYQTTVWISSAYLPLVSSVEGANLSVDVPMTNITFQYNDSSAFTLANPSWTPTAVSTSANGPMGVYAADVDGDGDLDIVTASKTDSSSNGKVTWWENGGSGTWAANDIATNVDARSVYVEDLDGDGDLDVVAALFTQNTIKLYLNSGASNPVWTASNIDTNAKGATDVHVADMNGDGFLDVVSSSLDDDTIAWYKNDGQSSPGWTSTNIDTSRSSARAVDVADMDGDGDLDIVTASSGDDTIAWYANGGQSTPSFTKTDISNTADGARDVRAADMDGDGDIDIVSASYTDSTIAWYENNGQATSWSSGVDIVTNASGAESVYVADLDNDGDLDIVSGSALDDTVAWYENDGQTNPSWDAYDLSTSYDARGIHTADMDGDGDLEIISVSHNDNTVALFEQTGTRTWSNSMVSVTGASSCTASPNLPTGLNIDSSTCTISGTPTVETINRTYTVTAVISGVTYQGSVWLSSSYLELTPSIEGADLYLDVPMTDITFHYNASTATTTAIGTVDGQITTYGNDSTWKVADLHSGSGVNGPGSTPMNKINYLIGDVHYFNAQSTTNGWELWAHNPSNGTLWEVTDISTASWGSYAGHYLDILVGDTLYFSANDGSSDQLWAHDTSNDSTWKVIAAESNSGATIRTSADAFIAIDGDVFYFSGSLGNGYELIAYNTSNGTLWEAADISGSTSSNPEGIVGSSHATIGSPILSDDVFVFTTASDYWNKELWAYNISNATAWEAYDINPGIWDPGNPEYIAHIDDVVYFQGKCDDHCNPDVGEELFAYNATNQTGWLVADIVPGSGSGNPGELMPDRKAPMVIDGTFYFDADDVTHGWELWAHTPANQTTWLAADINSGYGDSKPGWYSDGMGVVDGRLYFDADDGINGRELWVYDPSNASSWRLTDIAPSSSSGIATPFFLGYFGDTFYLVPNHGTNGAELWAYDPSNGSSWRVTDISPGSGSSYPSDGILIGNTIYFRATDGSTGAEMYAYQPAEITSSGSSGTCSISPGLPTGLNIDSSTCTISGTPTVESVNQTHTVTAVISGVTYQGSVWLSASTFGNITSAVEGAALNLSEAMTPITLNYTSQAGTATVANGSGNETRWTIAEEEAVGSPYHVVEACNSGSQQQTIGVGTYLPDWLEYGSCSGLIEDTIYFRGRSNASSASVPYSLWAFRPANDSVWAVTPHLTFATTTYIQIVDEQIYFIAMPQSNYIAGSTDLYVHDTTNGSTWMAYDVANNVAEWSVFGDHLLLHEWGGSSGNLLNLHTFSTNETWEVPGKWVHQSNPAGYKSEFGQFHKAGNQILFQSEGYYTDSNINNGNAIETGSELWVYDLSNNTTFGFDVSPVTTSFANTGKSTFPHFFHTIGTRTYFRACDTGTTWANGNICGVSASSIKHALWVYESSNTSIWRVTPAGEQMQGHWVGDQYWDLKANPDNSNLIGLRIFDSTNHSIWWETNGISLPSNNNAYYNTAHANYPFVHVWAGTRAYFTAKTSGNLHNSYYQTHLWAYEASNNSAWELLDGANVPGTSGNPSNFCNSQTGTKEHVVIGTEIFFLTYHNDACGGWLSMEPYGDVTFSIPPPTTWETEPPLPAGMSISGGVISGTPSVYANNQTYTIYANQSGYSTTHELYFSVDTTNAHTVVENQTIDPIGFHPPFWNGTTTWTVSPNLPASLTNSSTTGEITGTVTSTTTNATYTVTATHSDGSVETFSFNLQSLADYDGDGLANDLPSDYDAAEGPTPGLVADTDDDADGLLDTVETNTGTYVDSSNTGTDPLNPDTDGDGICDGPLAVPGVCITGPDITNGGTVVDTPIVLLNNSDAGEITPFYPLTGATYGLSPDLPTSMQFDSSNGSIWGTPDMLMTNTTYTMWANLTDGTITSWTFFLEVLEDLDGDGMPDVLPGDYNATNDPIRTPGLEEDLDDDGDGYNDTAETDTGLYLDGDNTGTDPRDPDTDDDGICDGPGTVAGVCTAGPDLTPFGPTATVVAVNNTMIPSVPPYYAGSGLSYGYSPDLPNGLTIDPNNGYLMGIPTETTGNITYTIYANDTNGDTYSWDFTIEVLEDSDGDGSPDSLPSDYDGDNDSIRAPPGLTEDLDDDGDGASDLDEIANGTEPLNPDTDGDGLCDGINAVPGVCFAGPDPYPNDPTMPIDTDGDGLPDDDSGWTGPPYADDDDDNDGYSDVSEDACGSDSLDASSIPADMDGDAICDGDDPDMDGDGIENVNETGDTTVPPGSSPINPDTDGDGICDGPESPVTSDCAAGPDMFPLDPSAWEDTDGDGYPNELFPPSTSVPPLEEDTDDDNDGWSDIDEVSCGSDPVDGTDMPVDENGDGICDVLDLDWDDDGIPNTNETDTGVYVDSSDTGTDPWNPDTDGDGFCDGPFAVMNGSEMICSAGPDPFPHDPTLPMDTDGDGLPNELPEDYIGNLVADDDDDNDGYTDVAEDTCGSDSLDNLSMPTDLDGDTICDGDDLDIDGDGILNDAEDATDSITSSSNADTDGDGVCDGPSAPAMPAGICTAGADAFPDDPAAWDDTDGDGDPDEIVDGMNTDLVLDTDDDDDGWEDVDELACETNSKNNMSTPFDGDDDGICDVLDTQTLGYAIYGNESDVFEAYVNQSDFVLTPNLTGMEPGTWTIEPALPDGLSFSGTARSGETGIISGIPTEASPMQNYTVTADNGRVNKSFTFGLAVLNDFDGDRIPDEESVTGLETDPDDDNDGHLDEIELKCGSDPLNQTSVPDVDEEGNCIEGRYAEDDSDDGTGVLLWCLPLVILLLVLLLLIPLLIRDKVALMGPEPENTTSSPAFMSGNGTKSDPFVLRPIKKLKAGSRAESKEAISITNMSPEILVDLLDLAESSNDKRFMMYEIDGSSEESGYKLEADEEGRLRLRFVFDDGANPTYPGAEYEGLLKLGKASVYLSWTVEVKEDKRKMNQIRKEQEAAEKAEKEAKEAQEKAKADAEAKEAEEKAEAEAKAAEEKAAKEAEKKAKAEEKAAAAALAKKEKEEAAAKKKEEAAAKKAKAAEEKAAKEAEEAEAKAKAEAEAKAAEEKAAKEAEKKAKAEEKAAAAAAAKKAKEAKEEAEAKKKAEAEAKAAEEKAAKEAEKKAKAEEKAAAAAAAKKAKEEADAKKKAEAEAKAAAKKKVEKKPAAAKEAKKQEELQRVKKRAKSIDFKVIGEASSSELKSEVKKGATTLEVANAKDFAESGSAEINDAKGSNVIAWTGKDGNTLTGVSGVTRLFAAKAVLMVKDDLQVIKGIGPFIEEKLNALGITTYRQLANMTAKLETQVNEAIEFFPGRVKRDQWVAQAKILLGMDAKLDEKALKQAEELERVAQKAEGIDFAVLGVASASEADDLQKIKGIGPFIAEKLNALGIYKFSQLANMTSEIEEEVNVAIEFFPGRVKRDEWAKQAKELAKD